MKKVTIAVLGAAAGLVAGLAYAKGKEAVIWPAAELKFEEPKPIPGMKVPEGAKPPMIATLWGDISKGAYGAIVKFQGGEMHPLHTHSADIKGIVLEGTWTIGGEGQEPKKLGPGSYFMVPGNWKHTSGCDASGPCTVFQEGQSKFDIKMVPEKK
jgi:quercetin dioxygenase-like cupin family protein